MLGARATLSFVMNGGVISASIPDNAELELEQAEEPEEAAGEPDEDVGVSFSRRGPAVDESVIQELADVGIAPSWAQAPAKNEPARGEDTPDVTELIARFDRIFGGSRELDVIISSENVRSELMALSRAALLLKDMSRAPDELLQGFLGYLVARARRVQDDPEISVASSDIRYVFSLLTSFSAAELPGYVYGLKRSHTPTTGTWEAEAKMWVSADRTLQAGRGTQAQSREGSACPCRVPSPSTSDPMSCGRPPGTSCRPG